jgi:hypothetical protein
MRSSIAERVNDFSRSMLKLSMAKEAATIP